MTQIDIYDKDGLPTFNSIIIDDTSDWAKVKAAIDRRARISLRTATKQLLSRSNQLSEQLLKSFPI